MQFRVAVYWLSSTRYGGLNGEPSDQDEIFTVEASTETEAIHLAEWRCREETPEVMRRGFSRPCGRVV